MVMSVKRYISKQITECLEDGDIAIVYGARQTGKTTLANMIREQYPSSLYLNCDEPDIRTSLTNKSSTELKSLIGNTQFVVVDEAQRVKDIGLTAKLIHDTYPDIKLLLAGSSSIDLANTIKEPLTGRSKEFILYPFASSEIAVSSIEAERLVEKNLIYGSYPKAWPMSHKDAADYLRNLTSGYLYRDAFNSNIEYNATIVDDLLRLLAFQVGSEMSYSEVATRLGISKDTVSRYIDLLEKAFIVFRLPQFRRNQRNEIGKLRKVYFYDLGIRNGLIDNFQPLKYRNDLGALWENYCIIERKKKLQKDEIYSRHYYWRSSIPHQEIDLVEEVGNKIFAYEFKYKNKKVKVPTVFAKEYPDIPYLVIDKEKISDFTL